jgi:predicted ester cyclase
MSTEDNKALVRRLYAEVMGKGNMTEADELLSTQYVEHLPAPTPGREGLKQLVMMVRSAFPDIHNTVEDAVAEGDRVAVRIGVRGTHQDAFLGIPPSGKAVEWGEIHIYRVVGGKIVEHWGEADQFGLLQQIGAIPSRS